jgi:hypothetical protein
MTADDQDLVLWGCLMHDVRKLSVPVIEGKDHVHPFKSGSSVLDVFTRLGFIEDCEDNKRHQTYKTITRLISESI